MLYYIILCLPTTGYLHRVIHSNFHSNIFILLTAMMENGPAVFSKTF